MVLGGGGEGVGGGEGCGGGVQGKSGRQMEEGSFIVSSLRIDSLSRRPLG